MSGSVGVLLPARLETRFDLLDGGWRLRLLVVPGEASVDVHDPVVRHDELDRLEAAAAACDGRLLEPEGARAFESLAQEIGAGRALWLVRTRFAVAADGWSVDRAEAVARGDVEPAPATMRGLPEELQVWAETESGHHLLDTLRPRARSLPVQPPRNDPDTGEATNVFWASWRVLRRAGLATTIDLGAWPLEPQHLRRLVVVGVGTTPAADLFTAHAHAGNAALLPPGTPTNVTAGAGHPQPTPRAHHALLLPRDVPVPLADTGETATADLARAVTGDPAGLPRLVGGDVDHRGAQHGLVGVAWPSLWGHAAQDLWGPDDAWPADELGRWVLDHLLPQGPLATLLVDDQPYGVLPLTPLVGAGDGHPVDDRLAPALEVALDEVARLAREDDDTVLEADGERLLRVLGRTPTSPSWAWRWSLPVRHLGPDVQRTQEDAVTELFGRAGLDVGRATDPPVTVGHRSPVLEAPAEPRARRDDPATADQWALVERMFDEVAGNTSDDRLRDVLATRLEDEPLRVLLGWLWHRLGRLRDGATPEICLEGLGDPWPDSLLVHLVRSSVLETWRWGVWAADGASGPLPGGGPTLRDHGNSAWTSPGGDTSWVQKHLDRMLDALHTLAVVPLGRRGDLDRATAALVDTATHRIDPWAVGLAWRRLRLRDDAPRVLGLYGYVDRPWRGQPGLGRGGVTLAPSPDQAKTAAILRDRAVAQHEDGLPPAGLNDVALDSERVRLTLRVTRAVREGAHPAEALGREIERLLPGDPEVREFRRAYPAHRTDAGRRTCDGLKALAAVRAGTIETDTGFAPESEVARRFGLLAELPADLADLLVAEAVHDTVTGGAAQAAVALDAASGLAAPPPLRFPATPAGGVPLRTTVHVVLPDVAAARAATVPADACPPASAHLDDALPDPDDVAWLWSAGGAGVTLADLGLTVADLVAVDDDTLLAEVAARLGAAPSDVVPATGLPEARRRIDLLARCSPGADLEPDARDDLVDRVRELRAAARALAEDLELLDERADLPAALARRALRWGVRGPAGVAASRVRALLPVPTDGAGPDVVALPVTDPVAELQAFGGGAGAAPGSPARRGPLLLPARTLPPVGADVADDWREVFGRVRSTVTLVPLGWAWQHGASDDPWTGRPEEGGGRVSDVVVGPQGRGGPLATGVLDAWTETLPAREVPVTAAFSFHTPGARPPQAILLAVPAREGEEVDVATARDVVRQAALLSRARSVPPSRLGSVGALLPSLHLPAGERGGVELQGVPVFGGRSRGLHVRLEPVPPDAADLDAGLRAEVGDPVWMLARQWQLGEHAGEDASSPVEYRLRASRTPLRAPAGRPFADPRRLPGEAVLEAAAGDVLLPGPVRGRGDPWDPVGLWHSAEPQAGAAPFSAREHDGGEADWWSLDLGPLDGGPATPFTPVARRRRFRGLPGRMDYPGAPEPGWFTLEDPQRTVTGHLPDPTHVSSLFFLDVVAGHATDWYLANLPTPPGHVVRLEDLQVRDSFGDLWPPEGEGWRREADGWTTPFRTKGLEPHDLLAWFATPPPLHGDVLEQVVMGVDEDADLLWVVEERIDGHDAPGPSGATVGSPSGVAAGDRVVGTPPLGYRLTAPSPGPWHPYPAVDPSAGGPRRFRQGRLRVAGDGAPEDNPLPDPSSRFLAGRRGKVLPEIDPAAVPAGGLRLERRWVLARARDGRPVLWQQRRRLAPRTAPAFAVGHDRTAPR
ncbi:hypothetical protein G7072_13760 [Nocardioides sp. HDW12B]|uniref:hypothetical protein n=1 Tax=Nocardioides sp. HDW12B TaxID=2714939 RepID=UPI001409ACAE|nr:hypothetical protein [Nocardioides sp. HDW12B]QIK67270.1 hypothetical protein G7072_13760 [Nocardioides sp. HDW12B]